MTSVPTIHSKNAAVRIGLLILSMACAKAGTLPKFIDRSKGVPDFCQTDPAGKFPKNGAVFCGPTAVANSLVYLGGQGFPRVLPAATNRPEAQILIIRELASSGFMDTVDKGGTSPPRLMAGVECYLRQSGYRIARLEQQGWKEASRRYPRQAEIPSLDWIEEGLSHPDGAVWLNVGWYKREAGSDIYARFGGHWITVVGYGQDQDGREDGLCLLIHDPAPRTGMTPRTQYVKLIPLSQGTLERKLSGNKIRRHEARGFFEMRGEMVLKRGTDAAILDAAVVLVLESNSTAATP